jgi:CubicO group peptidase (beta-lactamase class C family)
MQPSPSRTLAALILCLLVLPPIARAQAPTATPATAPPDLDAFVARLMKQFDVPGISLAIVKDGRVIVAKGYGVKKLGEPTKVDGKTLFGIASNTKVFTATALGMLVEEGKVEWDAPVIKYLPWFQMYDPFVTRELTVRDLLVHRSGLGLGAGDLLWWPASTYNRKEIARRLQFIKPATSFRSAYAYDNVLYLIAGEVIEAVSGQSWEDFITDRILKKVGMTDSKPRHSDATGGGNIATPHAPVDGKVVPIKPFDSDNTNPAGGINSNAEDLAKWMLVRLADGKLPDGSQLYSDRTSRALTTLVTPLPINPPPPELPEAVRFNFRGYGLGLDLHDYRGHKVVSHTGGLPGYVSKITLVPDAQLGVAVLTNQESGAAFTALTWQVLDQYLNAPQPRPDWIDAYAKVAARQQATIAETEKKAVAARDAASKPSLPLERYAGTYTDAWYGDIAIANESGKLVMRFSHTPSLTGDLEHFQHDTFIARWRDRELRADAYVIFALDADGSIDQIKMRAVSPSTDFSFDFQDLLLRPNASAKKP